MTNRSHTRTVRTFSLGATVLLAAILATVPSAAQAALGTPVPLGSGASFVVLAGAGVTNTGATTLGGDIGSFETTSISGLGTITLAGGVNHGGDAVTQQAKTDLVTAYNDASSQSPDSLGGVELAGLTLEPGVYDTGGVIELNGNLTLDANGDPAAVFVFQSLSTLLAATGSSITFIDGATACNLYWRVPSSATIQAGSQFAGTILASTSITFGAGATLQGRALAQTGEVTLITNTFTLPSCATVPGDTDEGEGEGGTGGTGGVGGAGGVGGVPGATDGSLLGAAGPAADVPAQPQVRAVPRGGVATGDGSSLPAAADHRPALGLALLGLGTVALLVLRPRRGTDA